MGLNILLIDRSGMAPEYTVRVKEILQHKSVVQILGPRKMRFKGADDLFYCNRLRYFALVNGLSPAIQRLFRAFDVLIDCSIAIACASDNKWDVVLMEWLELPILDLFLLWRLRWLGKRVFIKEHNALRSPDGFGGYWFNRLLRQACYRFCSGVIVHTAEAKESLQHSYPFLSNKLNIVPHPAFRKIIRRSWRNHNGSIKNKEISNFFGRSCVSRFVFFGNGAAYKGASVYLQAVELLLKDKLNQGESEVLFGFFPAAFISFLV